MIFNFSPKWEKGRQGTGYCKKTFISKPYFDLHLLWFVPGDYIPPHKDKLKGGLKHYRLNILLTGEDSFSCEKVIFKFWRFTFFRPDLYEHFVPTVSKERKLLSIGFCF